MSTTKLTPPGGYRVNNPLPDIAKYFNKNDTKYTNTAQVLSEIPTGQRHPGLYVNVSGTEYWWPPNGGVTDGELVIKTSGGSSYPVFPTSDGREYFLREADTVVAWEEIIDANGASFDNKTKLQAGDVDDWDIEGHYTGSTSGAVIGTKGGMIFFGTDQVNGAKYKYECITDNNWYRTQRVISMIVVESPDRTQFEYVVDNTGGDSVEPV